MKPTSLAVALLFLCAGFGPAGLAHAGERSLSLSEAVAMALENNPSVRQERIALDAADRDARTVWNKFLPGINLSGSIRKAHDLPNASSPLPAAGPEMSLSAGLSLSLNAGIPEAIRQTLIARDAAALSLARAESALTASVSKAYYSLIADGAGLEASVESLKLAQALADQTEKNYRNGLASELDALQARYAAAVAQQELLVKRQAFGVSSRNFNALAGLELDERVIPSDTIEPDLAPVAKPPVLDRWIEGRNDVASARLALEKARSADLAAAINRFGPTLSLSEQTSVSGLQDGFSLPETATFTLSVSLPLDGYIPGSRGEAATRQSRAAAEVAALALEKARLAARQEIETLFANLEQLREGIALKRMNEEVAARAYDLSGQGYASGLVTQTALDDARTRLLSARLAVLSAENSYQAALIDLAAALNVRIGELYGLAGGK